MLHDLIIIGAGPAGITAAVYAARKKMDFLVISKDIGGQTIWSADIENYTGFQFITGTDLVEKFTEHLKLYNVDLKHPEETVSVTKTGNIINIKTDKGEYTSKTLIIASGRMPRKLGVQGEDDYIGKGVAYCATCDAPLFSGKAVAVIGGGNSALDAVLQLVNIASKVYLIDISKVCRADPVMLEKAKKSEKVIIYNNTEIKMIKGEKFVSGLLIIHDGKELELEVNGIFIEIGSIPASDFIDDIEKNKAKEIKVNCQTGTNIPGIFTAGDVTDVYAKQIIIACGEGAKAALASFEYINKLKDIKNDRPDYWEEKG